MSNLQVIKISRNFPLYTLAKSPHVHTRQLSHLMSTQKGKVVSGGCEMTLGQCYLSNVQYRNDEDFQKFTLIYFYKVTLHPCETTLPPCVHSRQLCHLMAIQNGKVISCGCKVTLGRCYLSTVQSTNDEDFQEFSLLYFCKVTLCGHPHLVVMQNGKVV